jgi:hypothetical protein
MADKAQEHSFQPSKHTKDGLSPTASMSDTILCQVCYPSGKLPQGQTLTSHHPRGRWEVSVSGQTIRMCTRHFKASGGRMTASQGKAYRAAVKARAVKAQSQD